MHNTGFIGGAGRALVFLSFSAALAACGAVPIVVDRIGTRAAVATGLIAFGLCATVAAPGVQTESHLDPKWLNVPAVIGVGVAVALTGWATARGRRDARLPPIGADRARLAVGVVALFFAAPYIAAELGFFLDGVPLLGSIFETGRMRPEPGAGYSHPAVHHGHHHGMDGFLLAVSALLLSRLVGGIRNSALRDATAFYLALMLVYGLTNEAEDLWIEQVVKRGWTAWQIPNVLHPSLSLAWAAMVGVAALLYVSAIRPRRQAARPSPRS